jgi:hypothetical protein
MKRNVYVVIKEESVECYSNLTKLIKSNSDLTYFSVYRALTLSSKIERDGITIVKTVLK